MSQKRSILGSKIDFRVRQSYHFLIFDVPAGSGELSELKLSI